MSNYVCCSAVFKLDGSQWLVTSSNDLPESIGSTVLWMPAYDRSVSFAELMTIHAEPVIFFAQRRVRVHPFVVVARLYARSLNVSHAGNHLKDYTKWMRNTRSQLQCMKSAAALVVG